MVKKLNPILVQKGLAEKDIIIFSPREFQRIFAVSGFAAQKFIHQHARKGFFNKLKNGLYCLSSAKPHSFVVANKLYAPSYISLATALSFHGIIPETSYGISSVSTKATRDIYSCQKEFTYSKIKKSLFTGYGFYRQNNEKFFMAEPEKALLDYLYFLTLNSGKINSRINITKLNKQKIKKWQKLFNNPKIDKFITELYAG
ncbi:hypothetical protein A2331_07145 [Candidatus Falkowbacteria bacterium RIFOXYB2_FULL_34_18]|uniref:AbiEi antitoxin C-terminal domain-containing protein n=1 Tax=Candidatus Falkowbacteria bacterium RIFOXYD2_FULL_34_120 TaxID=1798007 RepID=A0A1F5TRK9_9BACT|nr:MAG: hypothetical protein A2331_07145 [Candidatus Falkowbacteria bacterium RIFOXYB2_FULL_34_18]OGF29907.1 MAG: hypothetical protein A2500_03530 [Candidatus Falkowbacteria bacterium RIFOXYC12_FULL_34_55]OGF37235.1 MAG: hypothetical protein A2466_02985 [Candidatus Falkowbacteria bacterium RIFOXYC2_FULL_34_220]OGF39445.1 MAG: hypothetical protein A2515_03905 [Candidatus Falkowbacteria bacterium RIFOXYD12_FULL_34_57]OGF41573.1 MAG: hypothetical protein A2531_02700 [Candidatus Falkowbacteria bact